jgi:AcrR family transcriptional regulator
MQTTKSSRWERRPEARPQELLDAALTVFAAKGYRNTKLDEIAEAAGVTKGTIYHYFSTKEELLLRAIEHYHDRAFGRLSDIQRATDASAAERVRSFVMEGFGSGDPARRRIHALLQGIGADAPAVRREWLKSGPRRGWRLLTKIIEEGQAAGEFRADADAEVAARLLVSGLMLQFVWQQKVEGVSGFAIAERRLLDSAVDLILHSLRPVAHTERDSR